MTMHQKSGCSNFFSIHVPKSQFWKFSSCLTLSPSSSSSFPSLQLWKTLANNNNNNNNKLILNQFKTIQNYPKKAFLYHGPLISAMRKPLLPFPLQNPLDLDIE